MLRHQNGGLPINDNTLKTIGDYALYVAAVAAVCMLLAYLFRSAWYSSRGGRALLTWMLSTAAVLCFNSVSVYFMNDYPGRLYVRLALYGLLAGINVRWFFAIVRIQNQARRATVAKHNRHEES